MLRRQLPCAPLSERLALALPVGIGFGLRRQGEGDVSLLRALFVARRGIEFEGLPLSDAQRLAFLDGQADLQSRHYAEHYPQAAFLVVERAGQAIGRLCVDEKQAELRVVDIALMPAWQRQGIGTALLRAVLAVADLHDKACALSVDACNPAQALYQRLGFEVQPGDGLYLPMHRFPVTA
ncbi:GNAT family N-acetyltransferase [Pseudomonas sp. SWI44]|uniref:GNAT family N-acetyltransferase n=1 Tax=Pseudomonas sp. SWI44 TaxID=2083053 RepID=UPI000CE5D9D7|nr:GNAT family N-acetyltransferase [Pseudomonas sp. SWI44]AVD90280.1 GNAT family N-acetyltransferase [Pseudomonas sp. SWI44]